MTFKMACADVVPGCPAVFEADTKEELLGLVGAHANTAHADDSDGDGDEDGPGCEVLDQVIVEH